MAETNHLFSNEIEALRAELDLLREENRALREWRRKSAGYLRGKIDQLLTVIGTAPLRPEELDDDLLVSLDPIGIVSEAFAQILENLRQTNEKLTLARDEIGAIFQAAGNGIMVLNPQAEVLSYNAKLRELFLADGDELIGCCCQARICTPEARREACVFDMVMRSGQTENRRNWQSAGRHYDVVGSPIKNSAGEIVQVVLVYNDITDRKKAEEAVRQALTAAEDARAKMGGILQSVADPLIVADPGQRIVLMNRSAETLLGVCLYQSRGLPLVEVIADARLLKTLQGAGEMKESGERVDFSLPAADGGGVSIYQGRTSLLPGPDGRASGTIIILRNVTREREIERLKSEFVSTAAHELQTPLAAIIGFAELLLTQKDDLTPDLERESLEYIFAKADLLSKIVDDLLDISRIESGRPLPLLVNRCELNALIERVVRPYRIRSDAHLFELYLPAEPVEIMVDRRKFEQILDNILSNAFKYSPEGGLIRMTVQCGASLFQVSVEDQGIGMSGEQKSRIYDKFYRGDASNTSIGGTGLGMSITKYFVEAHGGRIWVDSELGLGTKVSFELPIRQEDWPEVFQSERRLSGP